MAKGKYNISVSSGSNLEASGNNNNEAEFENQECMNSCLNPGFLRSLSFHDRPRSSRVPTNKELHKSRYKALVSSSLEKIPSNPVAPSKGLSEYRTYHDLESIGIDSEVESTIYDASSSDVYQQTDQNQLSGADNWLEDRYTRFGMEAEKLLEKTIAVLRTVDKDISESLTNLAKPESIALESVAEVYKNKGKSTASCSAVSQFDLSTERSSQPTYENRQPPVHQTPKDLQAKTSGQNRKDLQARTPRQSPKNLNADSAQCSPKNLQAQSAQLSPKNLQAQSAQQSPKNLQAQSAQQSPKNLQAHSAQHSPKNLQAQSAQHSPKNLQAQSAQRSPKNLQAQSAQQSPKNLQAQSAQRSPKNLPAQSQQKPKNLVVPSSQRTLKNLQSLSSDSGNIQSSTKLNSDDPLSVEKSPRNVMSSPKISAPDNATEGKSLIDFNLPSDHEQFIKIIGALQNRCLEYREMIQDVAVLALEECLNFSELSINRIRHLRKQFESQKWNFRDFKELCCESVVFGQDSQPIDEKVTEVIQSFYLKLLQEENETFMARLEFGLKTGEIYAKMQKFENESKKIITTLEREILYLKKTSVGFKV